MGERSDTESRFPSYAPSSIMEDSTSHVDDDLLPATSPSNSSTGTRHRHSATLSNLFHSTHLSNYWSRSSGGRIHSGRVEPQDVMCLFEWTHGGDDVFIKGSWDHFNSVIPMEKTQPGVFRVVLPVPEGQWNFSFVVDGQDRVSSAYQSEILPTGDGRDQFIQVNTRLVHRETHTGPLNRGSSFIAELDIWSPTQIEEYHAPWLFRTLYLAMFPAGLYYFVWLSLRGGNQIAPVCWITFLAAEVLSFISAFVSLFAMWAPVRRRWRSLDGLKPPHPSDRWPSVDVVICHYREPIQQIQQTVRAAMAMDYPSHLLRVIVADDGYFPKPKSIEHSEMGEDMHSMLAFEAGHDPLLVEPIKDNGRVEHYQVLLRNDLSRPDCALETHVIDYGPYGKATSSSDSKPRLCLVSRVKPTDHHNKAGNINNVLFNAKTNGDLILFLDSDMKPNQSFLKRTIPLLLRSRAGEASSPHVTPRSSKSNHPTHDESVWELDSHVAFVQTPQRFHNASKEDYLAVRNAVFYDAVANGRDGFGLTPFAGTNCLWRREVLNELGGIIYGSVTEDTLTSNGCHSRGYMSKYACEDLCWGEAPVTAAAAMLQRLRWAKGAVQNGIFAIYDHRKARMREKESHGSLKAFQAHRRHSTSPHNGLVRFMFWLDSTLYPVLNLGAYLYIFVALYYLISAQPPIRPESVVQLTSAFVTYYAIRYAVFFTAYRELHQVDVLRAMETWFSYAAAHSLGMYEALNPNSKLSWVQNTGEGIRRHWSEWVNILLASVLVLGICFRLIAFLLIDDGCRPWNSFGGICFGLFCLRMLWPMASLSLNERISSLPPSRRANTLLEIPIAPTLAVVTVAGVLFLAGWVNVPCGQQSVRILNLADELAAVLA